MADNMRDRLVPRYEDHEASGGPSMQELVNSGDLPAPRPTRAFAGLFRPGRFTAHSGTELHWKLECDALTVWDWANLAGIAARKLEFSEVLGVPRGGLPFAEALRQHQRPGGPTLIVDDVLTTGRSMHEFRDVVMRNRPGVATGLVLFARGECPSWILPMFTVSPWLR